MSELADLAKGERRKWAAPGSSHDRIIKIARALLPAGIGAMIAMLVIAPVTMGRDISFVLSKDKVAVAKERLRVTDAHYRGQDGKGQPFMISAASAVQVTSRIPIVKMHELGARIMLNDGPAAIAARAADYDMSKEKINVIGPVLFKTLDGYRLLTRDVGIDLNTRTLASAAPVEGLMPLGNFTADRLNADLNARTVTLSGRARLHIVQSQYRGAR